MESIKETKEALECALSMQKALQKTMADGKISIWEVPNFLSPFLKLGPALQNAKAIPAELKDLQAEEIEELKALFKAELDLEDDKLEQKINEGLALLLALGKFVGELKS